MIKIGSKASDFALKDQNKKIAKLSSFKGKKIVLSFRPLAWTPVCHDQMISLEKYYKRFEELNTIAFGVGVDSSASNKAWAQSLKVIKTRLLADFWPHGEVAMAYGIFRENDGYSERANIIIDENQKVVFAKVYPMDDLPDIEEIIKFLSK